MFQSSDHSCHELVSSHRLCNALCSETGKVEDVKQGADGFFTRKLPAELLRDINIVDTPGHSSSVCDGYYFALDYSALHPLRN